MYACIPLLVIWLFLVLKQGLNFFLIMYLNFEFILEETHLFLVFLCVFSSI